MKRIEFILKLVNITNSSKTDCFFICFTINGTVVFYFAIISSFSYFSASKCFSGEAFRTACTMFITEGPSPQSGSINFLSPLESPVSWNQQLKFISSIPNLHRWQQNKVSFSQWLSVIGEKGKYKPASARNQILFYFREGCLNKVYDVCLKLQSKENPPQQIASTSTFTSIVDNVEADSVPSAPKRRRREPLRRLTLADLLANITSLDPQFSSQNLSQDLSSYEKFKLTLIKNGNLIWRRSSGNIDIFALNDVNMTTGLFQEDCYVHLTRITIDGVSELTCSCGMYTTLMQVASLGISEEEFNELDISNVQCCHMRIFSEMVLDFLLSVLDNSSRSENRLIRQLELMKGHINDPVFHLPTGSNRALKFSVYSEHDNRCAFVHITDNRLPCQSGYCDALFSSSKRYIIHLHKAEVLCPHLVKMKDNPDSWASLLEEAVDSVNPESLDEDEDDPDHDVRQPPTPAEVPVADQKVYF